MGLAADHRAVPEDFAAAFCNANGHVLLMKMMVVMMLKMIEGAEGKVWGKGTGSRRRGGGSTAIMVTRTSSCCGGRIGSRMW